MKNPGISHGNQTLPQGWGFLCVFLPCYFYLLDKKFKYYVVLFTVKINAMEINLEWALLTDLLLVTGCTTKCSPFS